MTAGGEIREELQQLLEDPFRYYLSGRHVGRRGRLGKVHWYVGPSQVTACGVRINKDGRMAKDGYSVNCRNCLRAIGFKLLNGRQEQDDC